MNKWDSKAERDFAYKYELDKNDTQYVIYKPITKGVRPIKYTPDFVINRLPIVKNIVNSGIPHYGDIINQPTIWIEYKGYHKEMGRYYLKRKLVKDYCTNNYIQFYEVKKTNNGKYKWNGKECDNAPYMKD